MFKSAFRRYIAVGTAAASLSLATALPAVAQTEEGTEDVAVVVEVETDEHAGQEQEEEFLAVTLEGVASPSLWLGIQLKPVEADLAAHLGSDTGIFVMDVVDGSPAEKAGIQDADIIVKCDGTELNKVETILEVLSKLEGDDPSVELKILRHGKEKTIVAHPAPRPDDLEEAQVHKLRRMMTLENGDGSNIHELLLNGSKNNAFEFVAPGANIWVVGGEEEEIETGDLDVKITKKNDGKSVTVVVEKSDGKPATCVVTEDGKVTEYSGDELEELPKHIRVIVDPLLKPKSAMRLNINRGVRESLSGKALAIAASEVDSESISNLARKIASEVEAAHKKVAKESQARAESFAKKAAEAREHATEARVRLRSRSSSEIEELRDLVNELKAELAKLRKQIDSDK